MQYLETRSCRVITSFIKVSFVKLSLGRPEHHVQVQGLRHHLLRSGHVATPRAQRPQQNSGSRETGVNVRKLFGSVVVDK
jgi:hypothetical protein